MCEDNSNKEGTISESTFVEASAHSCLGRYIRVLLVDSTQGRMFIYSKRPSTVRNSLERFVRMISTRHDGCM